MRNNNGEEYLTISTPTEVRTCGGLNICDEIKNGKQSLSIGSNGELQISSGNSVQLPDASATNELQSLTLSSDGQLGISSGNSVKLPDYSATNELQSLTLSSDGQLGITNGNSVQLPDSSQTNELQSLNLSSDGQLGISGGNSVQLPDSSATNELQSLTLSSSGQLGITNGNSVQLPTTWTKFWKQSKSDTMPIQPTWTTLTGYVVSFTVLSNTSAFLISTNVRFALNPSVSGLTLSFIVANEVNAVVDYVDFYNTDYQPPVTSVMTSQSMVAIGLAPGTYTAQVQVVTNIATTITFSTSNARLTVSKISD